MMTIGVQHLSAQGTYVNIGLGYGMNSASASRGYNQTTTSSISSTNTEVHGSYGKGFNFGATFGYMFSKNVGAELGINYLIGRPTKITYTDNINSPADLQTDEFKVNMLRIIPSVVIAVGEGKMQPYAKIGLALGVMGKGTNNNTGKYGTNTSENTWEYNGGTAIGFASALGLKIGGGNMAFFGEIAMINQSWAPAKKIQTKSTNNGVDQLAYMTINQKETDYVESYTYTNPNVSPPDQNSPQQSSKLYLPMSSFGINVGLRIAFGK